MESIYYVVSWLCHRTCAHCYEERFRPYYGAELERVTSQAARDFPRIIENFPARMDYLDPGDGYRLKTGRVILAGGEVLLDPVREPVLYPALDLLRRKYGGQVHLVVQTTGDVLNRRVLGELLDHGVWMVSVSGMDEYHEGIQPEALRPRLTSLFEERGMREFHPGQQGPGPYYHFFGATPDSWIGKLWPRGRAWTNELSKAELSDNFCNRWSGGLNFLRYRHAGSEVSVDPEGNVYPCCIKTRLAIGSLLEERLEEILDRCALDPVYQAISAGHPELMGVHRGWTAERFWEKSATRLPSGRLYRNVCVGCDRFHEEEMMGRPELVRIGGVGGPVAG